MTGPTHLHLRQLFLRTVFRGLTPAVLAVFMAGSAAAQYDEEPPALVGRISAIHGGASIQRASQQDWVDAGINEPVTIGDAVYAPEGADVRLQIGATDFDLKSDSEIDIAQLDENAGTIRLDSGRLDLRVAAVPTADGLSIATPRGTVRLTQPGIYNIDTGSEDEPTRVTAWTGSARMGDSATAVTIQQGQVLIISGTADAPQYSYSSDVGDYPREWRTPPRIVQVRETERYVAPEMTGAEDLYEYGSFETAPEYGTVWYPRDVPADWQPYRFGHWEYVQPWGQTWIDDRPWGFAPFHYGRWAYIGNRWGWVPGQYTPHPVYAPALVAFVGGGGLNVSISIGGGGGFGGGAVGWVPLAPGEGYQPPYRASQTYIQNINKTTIVNKTTIINNNTVVNNNVVGPRGFGPNAQPQTVAGFANRRFATVVPAEAVAARRPIAQAAVQVRPEQIEKAQVNPEAVRVIKPEPAAIRPAAKPGPVARPANPRQAANVRPALPPARNQPGAQNRPGQPAAPAAAQLGQPGKPAPNAQQRPAANPPAGAPAAGQPGQRPAPNVQPRPGANPPAVAAQPARPDNHPAAVAKPGPEAKTAPEAMPASVPRQGRPAVERPGAPKPEAAQPGALRPEPAKPEAVRPQANQRPGVNPNRPEAQPPRPPRPEAKPAENRPGPAPRPEPQNRPVRPETGPQPTAQRPEARQAPAPRPEPRQQPQAAARPQPQPHPQAQAPRPQPQVQAPRPQPQPHPQAQAPHPQPQVQAPRPQPQPHQQAQPQQQHPQQQHPGQGKKPDDNK
jgi:hypothetical protein